MSGTYNPGMSLTSIDAALAPILRVAQVRDVEHRAGEAALMERAGLAAAERARDMMHGGGKVLVLAGPGNNGGDAFVVARHLRAWFFDVTVAFAGARERLPADAAAAYAAYVDGGGDIVAALPEQWHGALVIDGLFGIGLKRAIDAPYAAWIEWANGCGTPVLALDVPSGLDAETGMSTGPVIAARKTITFIARKPGLVTGDGVDLCGHVHVDDLRLDELVREAARGHWLTWPELAKSLPAVLQRRRSNVHKGTFGTLCVIGGARGMIGAPLLAGRAALRAGAGRVRVGYASRSHPSVDFGAPELMARGADAVLEAGGDVFVVGPGLGTEVRARDLLGRAVAMPVPLVLDADALNLVATDAGLRAAVVKRDAPTLLTPHPAEAARLLNTETRAIQANRLDVCLELARTLHAHVVLKGAGSVLAAPDGRWDVNGSGNPGLSAAGSGDVLAGFAGAMLGQRLEPYDALRYAVCLHGAAADALVARGHGPLGMVASELGDAARDLVNGAARALAEAEHR